MQVPAVAGARRYICGAGRRRVGAMTQDNKSFRELAGEAGQQVADTAAQVALLGGLFYLSKVSVGWLAWRDSG